MGMTPPAAATRLSEEGVSDVGENGMASRFKDNPVVIDKCDRLSKSHVRKNISASLLPRGNLTRLKRLRERSSKHLASGERYDERLTKVRTAVRSRKNQ